MKPPARRRTFVQAGAGRKMNEDAKEKTEKWDQECRDNGIYKEQEERAKATPKAGAQRKVEEQTKLPLSNRNS